MGDKRSKKAVLNGCNVLEAAQLAARLIKLGSNPFKKTPLLVTSCELIDALFGYSGNPRAERYFGKHESVAQSVEQRTFNPWVEGSSPSALIRPKPWFFLVIP
jgi:hypothetical protein